MNKKQIIDQVEVDLKPILEESQFELVDVEFVKEGSSYYLRIYIDKEGGIVIDDCQKTSRAIEAILDEKDLIKTPYILEVSSPGLDRVLKKEKDFERFKGSVVDIKMYEAIDKKKKLTAKLIEKTAEYLIVEDEGNRLQIPIKNIAIVRLAVIF